MVDPTISAPIHVSCMYASGLHNHPSLALEMVRRSRLSRPHLRDENLQNQSF